MGGRRFGRATLWEGDAPAEPPMCLQSPVPVLLGSDTPRVGLLPIGEIISPMFVQWAARQEPRPPEFCLALPNSELPSRISRTRQKTPAFAEGRGSESTGKTDERQSVVPHRGLASPTHRGMTRGLRVNAQPDACIDRTRPAVAERHRNSARVIQSRANGRVPVPKPAYTLLGAEELAATVNANPVVNFRSFTFTTTPQSIKHP